MAGEWRMNGRSVPEKRAFTDGSDDSEDCDVG